MDKDGLEADAVLRTDAQALAHQVLAGLGDAATEFDAGAADLVVLLEGDVALTMSKRRMPRDQTVAGAAW